MKRIFAIHTLSLISLLLVGNATPVLAANPEYLSDDPNGPYAWIERQQKRASNTQISREAIARYSNFVKLMLAQRVAKSDAFSSDEERTQVVEGSMDLAREILDQKLPTRFEDPIGYFYTLTAVERVRSVLTASEKAQIPVLAWGTLPVNSINAGVVRLPSGYAIFYHRKLFQSALLLFQYAFDVIESREKSLAVPIDDADALEQLQKNSELIESFSRLVVKYVRSGTDSSLRRADNDQRTIVSMRQVAATELFFAAHEFGHILGNDGNANLAMLEIRGFNESFLLGAISHSWGEELRADRTGYSLAKRAKFSSYLGEPSSLEQRAAGAYGPVAFLAVADALEDALFCGASGVGTKHQLTADERATLLEHARKARSNGTTDDDPRRSLGCRDKSHPPAWIRAELLEEFADEQFRQSLAARPEPFGLVREAAFYKRYLRGIAMLHRLAQPRIRRLLFGPYSL